jgi:Kef-type K+ transport system membrane component KefB
VRRRTGPSWRMNPYWIAVAWMGMALVASLISIRIGISVAMVEILVGAPVGNIPGRADLVQQTQITTFLATFGSVVLAFLAGAEIGPDSLRRHWRASIGIGFVSFATPFAVALLFSRLVLGWSWSAAKISGVTLSTTSVALMYAVMVETGLNRVDLGKVILAAASSRTWVPCQRWVASLRTSTETRLRTAQAKRTSRPCISTDGPM